MNSLVMWYIFTHQFKLFVTSIMYFQQMYFSFIVSSSVLTHHIYSEFSAIVNNVNTKLCLIYLIICVLFALVLLFAAVIHMSLKLIEIICHLSIKMLLETIFWYTVVKKLPLHHPVFVIYLCNVTKQGLWHLLLLFLFPYLMYMYTYVLVVGLPSGNYSLY
jgi:hypothetical protein